MLLIATLLLGALGGCEPYPGYAYTLLASDAARRLPAPLEEATYTAVDALLLQRARVETVPGPMVVGSIADIGDVNRTTPLGNTIAELVRSHLVQRGRIVTDLRLRSTVWMGKSEGELMLSRDQREIVAPPVTTDFVAGTYAVGGNNVYVSLKVIRGSDAMIVAAADFSLPRGTDVNQLLLGPYASAR
ncbi:MAG: FlgO family outer membrane protein [Acetobacteraceae bacterium]